MKLYVVIPVYRAGERLRGVVGEILSCRPDASVILVEDCGGDDSYEIALELCAPDGRVSAVRLRENVGQQRALFCGVQLALERGADMIVTMDDDGEHPPELISRLVMAVERGFELCYAIPEGKPVPAYRTAGAWLRDRLFFYLTGNSSRVRVGAYRIMTRKLAMKVRAETDGFIYLSAALFRHRPLAQSIAYPARVSDGSTYSLGALASVYMGLLTHYTPLRRLIRQQPRAAYEIAESSFREDS